MCNILAYGFKQQLCRMVNFCRSATVVWCQMAEYNLVLTQCGNELLVSIGQLLHWRLHMYGLCLQMDGSDSLVYRYSMFVASWVRCVDWVECRSVCMCKMHTINNLVGLWIGFSNLVEVFFLRNCSNWHVETTMLRSLPERRTRNTAYNIERGCGSTWCNGTTISHPVWQSDIEAISLFVTVVRTTVISTTFSETEAFCISVLCLVVVFVVKLLISSYLITGNQQTRRFVAYSMFWEDLLLWELAT